MDNTGHDDYRAAGERYSIFRLFLGVLILILSYLLN
jgi:hypothetical protein